MVDVWSTTLKLSTIAIGCCEPISLHYVDLFARMRLPLVVKLTNYLIYKTVGNLSLINIALLWWTLNLDTLHVQMNIIWTQNPYWCLDWQPYHSMPSYVSPRLMKLQEKHSSKTFPIKIPKLPYAFETHTHCPYHYICPQTPYTP